MQVHSLHGLLPKRLCLSSTLRELAARRIPNGRLSHLLAAPCYNIPLDLFYLGLLMRFTKMHGIGNDYVYVDAFAQAVAAPEALAVKVADRHFGVGGDGLVLIGPPTEAAKQEGATVRMRMFNADGSEAEMCGNAIRCVGKFAFDRKLST